MGGPLPLTAAGFAGLCWLLVAVAGAQLALRRAGLPMLGQGAAVAGGAYLTATLDGSVALPLAVLAAVAAGAIAGWLVGQLASRCPGGDPGLALWAGAWLALSLAANSGSDAELPGPVRLDARWLGLAWTPSGAGSLGLAAAAAVVVLLAGRRLAAGPLGTRLALVRQEPATARTLGIDIHAARAGALAACCALGALAGAGFLCVQGVTGAEDVSPLLSLQLAAAALAAQRFWWGPVAAVAVFELLVHLTDGSIAAAVLALAALLLRLPEPRPRTTAVAPATGTTEPAPTDLALEHVTRDLGGRRVLDDVSLTVRGGEVHALIGPNGAGKTTLLGAAGDRAGRTLQAPTAVRLPALAQVEAAVPGLRFAGLRHLLLAGSRGRDAAVRRRLALAALELAGLPPEADPQSGVDLRLLQIARAAATGRGVLLLDEPAAGVERAPVVEAVRRLAADGRGVLLVEHDLRVVRAVADRATALVAGRVVATGTVADVLADPAVRAAYLGDAPSPYE